MFDKFTRRSAPLVDLEGDRKAGSRAFPATNVAGNDVGVERKSTCPRSQSSGHGSKTVYQNRDGRNESLFFTLPQVRRDDLFDRETIQRSFARVVSN